MYRLLSKTEPTARKKHTCEWCGEVIEVGEKHEKNAGISDGDFQSWRAHKECIHMMGCIQQEDESFFDNEFMPFQHRRGKTYAQQVAARLRGDPEWRY
jgi:hypothetical protein